MRHMHNESNHKALQSPSKGSSYQISSAGEEEPSSRLRHGGGGRHGPVHGEANLDILPLGDILVDVDAGPCGMGLVVWIVGG